MKIYTRTGDKGKTSLLRGGRVPKYDLRVDTYGDADELNSVIGFVRSINEDGAVEKYLKRVQSEINVLCSDVAARLDKTKEGAKIPRVRSEWVTRLENEIDLLDEDLPPLTNFILPGGTQSGAALHMARTVCRRCERKLAELYDTEGNVNPEALKYVNRLSDYLFALARWANHRAGGSEEVWVGGDFV